MLNGQKIIVVMPAYNAAQTLAKTVAEMPRDIVDGTFDLPVPSEGKYKVELKFPYNASLIWDERLLGKSLVQGNPTIFKYDVSLNDGDCVHNFFEVSRK